VKFIHLASNWIKLGLFLINGAVTFLVWFSCYLSATKQIKKVKTNKYVWDLIYFYSQILVFLFLFIFLSNQAENNSAHTFPPFFSNDSHKPNSTKRNNILAIITSKLFFLSFLANKQRDKQTNKQIFQNSFSFLGNQTEKNK
jgi:hypothetical protein